MKKLLILSFLTLSLFGFGQSKEIKKALKLNFKITNDNSSDSFEENCKNGVIFDIKVNDTSKLSLVIYMPDSGQVCNKIWHDEFVDNGKYETIKAKFTNFELCISKWSSENEEGAEAQGITYRYSTTIEGRKYIFFFFVRGTEDVSMENKIHKSIIEEILNSTKAL